MRNMRWDHDLWSLSSMALGQYALHYRNTLERSKSLLVNEEDWMGGFPLSRWTTKIHVDPAPLLTVGLFSSLCGLLENSPVPPDICGPQLQKGQIGWSLLGIFHFF